MFTLSKYIAQQPHDFNLCFNKAFFSTRNDCTSYLYLRAENIIFFHHTPHTHTNFLLLLPLMLLCNRTSSTGLFIIICVMRMFIYRENIVTHIFLFTIISFYFSDFCSVHNCEMCFSITTVLDVGAHTQCNAMTNHLYYIVHCTVSSYVRLICWCCAHHHYYDLVVFAGVIAPVIIQ